MSENKMRLDWVDTARGLAMIFVYLGHWLTMRATPFAYSFHLQLFFLISGFFAVNQQKYTIKKFLVKQLWTLEIPLILWCWISFIIKNFDSESFEFHQLSAFSSPVNFQSNYWFIPALFSVSCFYYFIFKLIKNEKIILILAFILHIIFGEVGIVQADHNVFSMIGNVPVLNVINNWFLISCIPQYFFWYALGSFSFKYIRKFSEVINLDIREGGMPVVKCHSLGVIAMILSSLYFLKSVTLIHVFSNLQAELFINCIYKMACAIIICFSVIYISMFLCKCSLFVNIGRNTMALLGLEFITHSFISLELLPTLNLGIPQITTTVDVITFIAGQLVINMAFCRLINKCFPILNGGIRLQ